MLQYWYIVNTLRTEQAAAAAQQQLLELCVLVLSKTLVKKRV